MPNPTPTTEELRLRDARDRLIDLLRIGETYPLLDLPVGERLKVPYNATAKVSIDDSQPGVTYQLFDHAGNPAGTTAEGTGDTLLLETPKITEDVTYKILARKVGSKRQAYLHGTATVKVGLDATLAARIPDAPALDPSKDQPADTDARIVDYGSVVRVQIDNTQEGVYYRLIRGPGVPSDPSKDDVISQQDVLGDLHAIVLQTKGDAIAEDFDVRIRATKTFEPTGGQTGSTQTDLLDVVLPLKVRARTDVAVAVVPSPVVGYRQDAAVEISPSQPSVAYSLYVRRIPDGDFVHGPTPDPVVAVRAGDGDVVQVRRPQGASTWADPAGFAASGEAKPGTGAALRITIPTLADDSLVLVRAEKSHQAGDRKIASAVPLAQPAVALVRPDPARPLTLRAFADDPKSSRAMQVSGGQPGVFYGFRRDPDGKDVALPAYFHKRDEADDRRNKGVGQLAVEIDLAIATDPAAGISRGAANRDEVAPVPPILATSPPDLDATLRVRAVKAQTRVPADLDKAATVPSLPQIGPESAAADFGAGTDLVVSASRVGERYQPLLDGKPIGDASDGSGKDLAFPTGPLAADTAFAMLVTRPGDPGIAVERVINLPVAVRPRTDLAVGPASAVVDPGGATSIRIDAAQAGVSYQLTVGGEPVGDAVTGTGGTLSLPTGPIAQDTTFVVRAARQDQPSLAVELTQQAVVTVRPLSPPPPAPPPPRGATS